MANLNVRITDIQGPDVSCYADAHAIRELLRAPLVPLDFHANHSDAYSRPFTLYTDDEADWLRFQRARQGSE